MPSGRTISSIWISLMRLARSAAHSQRALRQTPLYTAPDEFLRYADQSIMRDLPDQGFTEPPGRPPEDSEESDELVDQIHEMGAAEAPMEEYWIFLGFTTGSSKNEGYE